VGATPSADPEAGEGAHAASLEQIYRLHGHIVLRRARRLLGNEEDAREVLQELFVSLVARPGAFEGRSAVTTWLYGATTNLCLNRIRNLNSRTHLLGARNAAASEAEAARAEAMTAARLMLARMPEELAAVAVHYYIEEMTHEEIAEVLGCSRRRVGDLLARVGNWLDAEEKARC
jgi:RNA polymerase sigma-70 factor (ECF subfamily)